MTGRAARPLHAWRWLGLPAAAAAGATLLASVPLQVAGLRLPEPVFAAVLAFAWPLIRPSILAPFAVLASGLFLDLWWGSPLGLWAFSLLAIYVGALAARSLVVGQPTPVIFAWWLGLVVAAFTCAALLTMLGTATLLQPWPVVWQLVATLALFPVATYLIDRYADEARRL